jgi:hypothetical protein
MIRRSLLLSLLVVPAAACTEPMQVTDDTPIAVATSADRVVVAATIETETTGFGCGGGGGGNYGRSVLFVSGDRGTTFERTLPEDTRPLTHITSRAGVFYAIAHDNEGGFGVMTSPDGAAWTQVASGTGYAEDIAVSPGSIAVAHGMGVLVSADGVTWTDRPLSESPYGFYQARAAIVGDTLAVGTAADGTIRLSTAGGAWRSYTVSSINTVSQLIAAGDTLLVAGYGNNGMTLARLDLANLETPPVVRSGFANTIVLTPAGLLDNEGRLATLDANGFGTPADHTSPFNAAAVDANEVVVVRGGTIDTSADGGLTFGGTIALPIVHTETPVEN